VSDLGDLAYCRRFRLYDTLSSIFFDHKTAYDIAKSSRSGRKTDMQAAACQSSRVGGCRYGSQCRSAPILVQKVSLTRLTGVSVSEERQTESSWLWPVRELVPQPASDLPAALQHLAGWRAL